MTKTARNRTITLLDKDRKNYRHSLLKINSHVSLDKILNRVINQDIFEAVDFLPSEFVDLLFIDPPYNLAKTFNTRCFKQMSVKQYMEWMDSWLQKMIRLLKPTASIYICGDWRSSSAIHLLCEKYFIIRNRITFEREKGRGSKKNWKNNSEDIWFCTVSNNFTFNADIVKLKRRVIAPYRDKGIAKDWTEENNGKYRLTYPSNIWTDITIPFWSMPENTPHPTQKPEELLNGNILLLKELIKNKTTSEKNLISDSVQIDPTVTIISPCAIGEKVVIGKNCTIGPNAIIGNNVYIEENAKISNCIVYNESYISQNTNIDTAIIADNCLIEEGVILKGNGENLIILASYVSVRKNIKLIATNKSSITFCHHELIKDDIV